MTGLIFKQLHHIVTLYLAPVLPSYSVDSTSRTMLRAFLNSVNPFTALACKISGLTGARNRPQTVYFPAL